MAMLRQRKRGTDRTDNKKHVICVSDDRYWFDVIFSEHFIQKYKKKFFGRQMEKGRERNVRNYSIEVMIEGFKMLFF